MIIELQQALSPEDMRPESCGVCGEPFVIRSVMASVITDGREDIGYACDPCVAYLGSRSKRCPSAELYHELLEWYPAPRWATDAAFREHLNATAYDYESQDEIYESARLFKGFDQS